MKNVSGRWNSKMTTMTTDAECDVRTTEVRPDADDRAERKDKLVERLTAYLAEFVETRGSGWAAATDADINGLCKIFREVIDLKFERDCDGDSVINFDVANRRHGRLISTFVPYDPSHRSNNPDPVLPADQLAYISDSLRAANYLISSGQEIIRVVQYSVDDVKKEVTALVDRPALYADRLAEVKSVLVPGADFETSKKVYFAFVRDFDMLKEDAAALGETVRDLFVDILIEPNNEIVRLVEKGELDLARELLLDHNRAFTVSGMKTGRDAYNLARNVERAAKLAEARSKADSVKSDLED